MQALSSPTSFSPQTLEGQSRLLAYHLSGYITCRVLSSIASIPKLSDNEVRKLCLDHKFAPLLSKQGGIWNTVSKSVVLPLLEKHLPTLIENRLLQVNDAAGVIVSFPKEHFHEGLKDMIGFYDDLEQACGQVARKPVLSTTVDLSIVEALERMAQNRGQGEDELLSLSTEKILQKVFSAEVLDRTPGILQGPMSLVLRCIEWSVGFFVVPILRFFLPSLLPQNPLQGDQNLDRLAIAGKISACRFLKELKRGYEMRTPSSPRIRLDRELFKEFLKKEIIVLKLSECRTQNDLDGVLTKDTVQKALDWISDQYVLDEVVKTIEEIVTAAWAVAKRPILRQRELLHLYKTMNDAFINPEKLLAQTDDIDQALEDLIGSVVKKKLHLVFRTGEKNIDWFFSNVRSWHEWKSWLLGHAHRFLGGTVEDLTLKHVAPIVPKVQKLMREKLVNFWRKPYSLRFGLVHRGLMRVAKL